MRGGLAVQGPVAPLLVWSGHPGEWEGSHPYCLAGRAVRDGVFFVGWRGHDELPSGFACADLLVAPSVGEAFGTVYLEPWPPDCRCSRPAPAARLRSSMSTRMRRSGWLVPPDDEDALVEALVEALIDPGDRLARGRAARAFAQRCFSWPRVAAAVAQIYASPRVR
jgi:D-inositol-3-phosphate glycosyltransferase